MSHMCRSRQNTNTETNKLIQIQNSLAKSPPWAACIDMDRSFLPLRARTCTAPRGGTDPPLRCRSHGLERCFGRRWCYFSVKRTEATDLPAFETATTALVPAGTLKLPAASNLPSPAWS